MYVADYVKNLAEICKTRHDAAAASDRGKKGRGKGEESAFLEATPPKDEELNVHRGPLSETPRCTKLSRQTLDRTRADSHRSMEERKDPGTHGSSSLLRCGEFARRTSSTPRHRGSARGSRSVCPGTLKETNGPTRQVYVQRACAREGGERSARYLSDALRS